MSNGKTDSRNAADITAWKADRIDRSGLEITATRDVANATGEKHCIFRGGSRSYIGSLHCYDGHSTLLLFTDGRSPGPEALSIYRSI